VLMPDRNRLVVTVSAHYTKFPLLRVYGTALQILQTAVSQLHAEVDSQRRCKRQEYLHTLRMAPPERISPIMPPTTPTSAPSSLAPRRTEWNSTSMCTGKRAAIARQHISTLITTIFPRIYARTYYAHPRARVMSFSAREPARFPSSNPPHALRLQHNMPPPPTQPGDLFFHLVFQVVLDFLCSEGESASQSTESSTE